MAKSKTSADSKAQQDQKDTNSANLSASNDVDNTAPDVAAEDQAVNQGAPSAQGATGTTVFVQQNADDTPVRAEDVFDRIARAFPREDQRLCIEEIARAAGLDERSTSLPDGMVAGVSTATSRGGPTPFAPTDLTGTAKENARVVPVGADGQAQVDEQGNLLTTAPSDPLTTQVPATDEDGNKIDAAGNRVDEQGNPVDDKGQPLNAE